MSTTSGSIDSPSTPMWWATTAKMYSPSATWSSQAQRPLRGDVEAGGEGVVQLLFGASHLADAAFTEFQCLADLLVRSAVYGRETVRSTSWRSMTSATAWRSASTSSAPVTFRPVRFTPGAGQPQRRRDVVGRLGGVELVDEPHPLLSKRQRHQLRTRISPRDRRQKPHHDRTSPRSTHAHSEPQRCPEQTLPPSRTSPARAANRIADNELPPTSKNDSATDTRSTPSNSANTPATAASTSSAGPTYSSETAPKSGAGNAFRSNFARQN